MIDPFRLGRNDDKERPRRENDTKPARRGGRTIADASQRVNRPSIGKAQAHIDYSIGMKPVTPASSGPVILGAGHVGRALVAAVSGAIGTRRSSGHRGPIFDLMDEATWASVPLAGRQAVWTFPAAPPEAVERFHDRRLSAARSVIVLGSTSACLVDRDAIDPVRITEETELDLAQPRVQGEEWLRRRGATVLRLAGIHGAGRDPAAWIRDGRIRDGSRLVNLIHVNDIVAVIRHFLAHPAPGLWLNVSDGNPLPWQDLLQRFQATGRLPAELHLGALRHRAHGKHVDITRLREHLPDHRFQSVVDPG